MILSISKSGSSQLEHSGVDRISSSELLIECCWSFLPRLCLWGFGGGGLAQSDGSELSESFLDIEISNFLLLLRELRPVAAVLGSRCCFLSWYLSWSVGSWSITVGESPTRSIRILWRVKLGDRTCELYISESFRRSRVSPTVGERRSLPVLPSLSRWCLLGICLEFWVLSRTCGDPPGFPCGSLALRLSFSMESNFSREPLISLSA